MRNRDIIFIQKMLDEIRLLRTKADEMGKEAFIQDAFVQRGFVMGLINIGEYSRNVSENTQKQFANIPWVKIRGLRNAAAHGYSVLNMEDIWLTITSSIPELETGLLDALQILQYLCDTNNQF